MNVEKDFCISKEKLLARINCMRENIARTKSAIESTEEGYEACCVECGELFSEYFPIEGDTNTVKYKECS